MCYYEHMNKRSCESATKGDVNMAEIKEAMPAPQPEALDMPDDEVLYELADLFRVFGDSTRIKILYALHDNELCVQDIANAVQLSQSAVSHQLRVLKDSKLVRFRREGKTVYYALDDDHVRSILSLFLTCSRCAFSAAAFCLKSDSSFRIEGFLSCVSFFAENS